MGLKGSKRFPLNRGQEISKEYGSLSHGIDPYPIQSPSLHSDTIPRPENIVVTRALEIVIHQERPILRRLHPRIGEDRLGDDPYGKYGHIVGNLLPGLGTDKSTGHGYDTEVREDLYASF